MISVDTNIIVRLLTQDDPEQFKKAEAIVAINDIFIAHTVILETEWVLRFAYKFESNAISSALRHFFGLNNVHLHHEDIIATALDWYDRGLDFADALHLAGSNQCETFATFDQNFIKVSKDLSPCTVKAP